MLLSQGARGSAGCTLTAGGPPVRGHGGGTAAVRDGAVGQVAVAVVGRSAGDHRGTVLRGDKKEPVSHYQPKLYQQQFTAAALESAEQNPSSEITHKPSNSAKSIKPQNTWLLFLCLIKKTTTVHFHHGS